MAADHDAYFEEVEARFENAHDFDLGLEEEFHVLDPETLELTPGFEALREAAGERLRERIAGELLRSEIEVATPRTLHFGQAAKQLLLNRAELFALAVREGEQLGAVEEQLLRRLPEVQGARRGHLDLRAEQLAGDALAQALARGLAQRLEPGSKLQGLGVEDVELLFETQVKVEGILEASLDLLEVCVVVGCHASSTLPNGGAIHTCGGAMPGGAGASKAREGGGAQPTPRMVLAVATASMASSA